LKHNVPPYNSQRFIDHLTSVDLFVIAFSLFYVALSLIFSSKVSEDVVIGNAIVGIGIALGVVFIRSYTDRKAANIVHAFYIAPLIPLYFKTSEYLSYPIHGKDYDQMLIMLDRMMFGVDPTVWLYNALPVVPYFIEYIQICYSLFYFFPVMLGIEMYRRRIRRDPEHHFHDETYDELETLRFVTVYGFFFSYVGYIMLPSVGPRFFLHDFWSISTELPGLLFTEPLRVLTNSGENILPGMTHDEAYRIVTRDAFPSGHTMMTLTTMILAFKFKAKVRWAIFIMGVSLIFATVYLRYHYVADLIGGAVFALFVLYTWEPISDALYRLRERLRR
jgi:membrane-associated phospholipid phosphatase